MRAESRPAATTWSQGLAGPISAVEVVADPNALIVLARQLNLLTCIPRLALDTRVASGALCALEVADLTLPAIQICFVTLAEYDDILPLKALRRAVGEAAASGENAIA